MGKHLSKSLYQYLLECLYYINKMNNILGYKSIA